MEKLLMDCPPESMHTFAREHKTAQERMWNMICMNLESGSSVPPFSNYIKNGRVEDISKQTIQALTESTAFWDMFLKTCKSFRIQKTARKENVKKKSCGEKEFINTHSMESSSECINQLNTRGKQQELQEVIYPQLLEGVDKVLEGISGDLTKN